MGWTYMLCAWDFLQRNQSLLLSVPTWDTSSCSNTCSDNSSDTSSDTYSDSGSDTGSNAGAGDNDHTTGGRMQVVLHEELGQLAVQMFMGLLCRVCGMHSNNHQRHDSPSNDYSCSKPIYLQKIVRKQREDEALG
jgi:hypothetical protein